MQPARADVVQNLILAVLGRDRRGAPGRQDVVARMPPLAAGSAPVVEVLGRADEREDDRIGPAAGGGLRVVQALAMPTRRRGSVP